MDWKNQLTKTPYLVLFIVLITVGVGTASALITITLSGNVIVTDDLTVDISTLFVDSSNDRVGIGTNTPERDLDVRGNLIIQGLANSDNIVIKRVGPESPNNVRFVISERTSDKDLWLYGFDGTTFKNFVGFDFPNYKIKFPATSNTLVVDAAIDQVTIEGKDIEMPWNSRVPQQNINTIVDNSVELVGSQNSITLGSDGLPVIAYLVETDRDLKVVKCGNPSCSLGNIYTVVDSDSPDGSDIEIGSDGFPQIVYRDANADELRLLDCGNLSCSSGNTRLTVVSEDAFNLSFAIGIDGNPVIAYSTNNDDLKVVKCSNDNCSSGKTNTTLDSCTDVVDISISIGFDGFPVIGYGCGEPFVNFDLKVIKCSNQACTATDSILVVDSFGSNPGSNLSMTIGEEGFPLIAYSQQSNALDDHLKFVKCGNKGCTLSNQISTIETDTEFGSGVSISLGQNGIPVILYYHETDQKIKLVKCGNDSCSSGNSISNIDSAILSGFSSSITIGSDGLPVMSYYDRDNKDLMVAKCGSNLCLSNWTRR